MDKVVIIKPRRAEKVAQGERWAANCLNMYYMAQSYSCPIDGGEEINSEGARGWLETWEKALDSLPHDEAMAARLIYCERIDAGQAAELMHTSRIKAAVLASKACQRLAEYFGRGVKIEESARITGARIKRMLENF